MLNEKIYFYEGNTDVYLETFILNEYSEYSSDKRPMMLICPGGGYRYCSKREAEPVARAYMAEGYNTAILYYSTTDNTKELYDFEKDVTKPHFEVAKSICIIRDNAEKWNIDPQQIAVIGFSAGGHLAGCGSILWDDERLVNALDCPYGYNKPDAAILCYPVITSGDKAHKGSFQNLLGDYKSSPNRERYSLEKQVKANVPPTFIFHTSADAGVPVNNSTELATALANAGVHFELHVVPEGKHGMSLGTREVLPEKNVYNGRWVRWSIKWLETIFGI